MNLINQTIVAPYRAVMDPTTNPLKNLRKSQQFQAMTSLGMMWTIIFCAGTGAWLWYGQLVVFHILVALGIVATGAAFQRARALAARS